MTGFSFCAVWPWLVHFEQVLSDLKRFRTILVKKLFRFKNVYFIGNENHFEAVFSTFLRFFEVFDRLFGFVLFGRFGYVSDF